MTLQLLLELTIYGMISVLKLTTSGARKMNNVIKTLVELILIWEPIGTSTRL